MADELQFTHLRAELLSYGEAVRELYQQNLIDSGHFATRNLLNNVNCVIEEGDTRWQVQLSLEEYWKYVEYDTAPHWPPVDAIREWVRIKPLARDEKEIKQVAYLVGRKIAREGTTGTHDLERAVQDLNDVYLPGIVKALEQDIADGVNAVITPYLARRAR